MDGHSIYAPEAPEAPEAQASRAANDDVGPPPHAALPEPPAAAAAGWDPHEVWCTRIRDPRRAEAARNRP